MLSIAGLDKLELMRQLWEAQQIDGMVFAFAKVEPEWNDAAARLALDQPILFFRGRMIGMDLSKNEVDPSKYDAIIGPGTAVGVVDALRRRAAAGGLLERIWAWMW